VARRLATARSYFPNVAVGDIEPLGSFATETIAADLSAWFSAYQAATGEPLAFLHADIEWQLPWKEKLTAALPVMKSHHVPFGVIQNPAGRNLSDADHAQAIWQRAVALEVEDGYRPDQVIFQSWTTSPRRVLPETSPESFTGMVASYLRERSALTVTRGNDQVVGQLTDSDGKGVPQAQVRLQSLYVTGPGSFRTLHSHGVVPPDARSALVAIRINRECRCSKDSDIALRRFQFTELQGLQNPLQDASFYRNADWQIAGNAEVSFSMPPGSDQASIAIRAGHDRAAQLNQATHFPVVAGSRFSFELRSSAASDDSGIVAVIFLGPNGREVSRQVVPIRAAYADGPTATTDDQGRFSFEVNTLRDVRGDQVRAIFGGRESLFPSTARVR
jgi:hypothetical protein